MSKIFCFGTTGGCLDAFYLYKELFFDDPELLFLSNEHDDGDNILGHKVAGPFEYVTYSVVKGDHFIFQCGSAKNHKKRHLWFKKAIAFGMIPTTLISSEAYVHETASIGEGSIVYPGVRIMANVKIGQNCIVLPNTVLNHDVDVGDYCIINSSCILNGGVNVGSSCYIGSSSSIKENVTIASEATVGMCSVVLKTLEKKGLYFGTPAKFIRQD